MVARFDTDDWCSPKRFEAQCSWMKKYPGDDVLGTLIAEFEIDPDVISGVDTAIEKKP
jgi:hypothetical protein